MLEFSHDPKTQILEDFFTPATSEPIPVCVIDYKVAAHFIHERSEVVVDLARGDEAFLRKMLRAMWAYKLNRGPDMLDPFPFVGIIADDHKAPVEGPSSSGLGYWRHLEAHKLGLQEYKGGRGEKPKFFDLVQEEGYNYINSPRSTFFYLSKPLFEADDIAGHICRLKRSARKNSVEASRELYLSTLDGDWQGLVSDAHKIIWANTGPWLPRLRSEREVCDYYLRKEGMEITTARGCYDFKVEFGDAGDNLAAGTPLRFFDLYNEDQTWKFSKEESALIRKMLRVKTPSNRQDHLEASKAFLMSLGLVPPEIPPTHPHDKYTHIKRADLAREKNSHKELRGRNRKKCLSLQTPEHLEECKKLAVEEELIKSTVEEKTQELKACKAAEDTLCAKTVRAAIKKLKAAKKTIREKLESLLT